MAAWLDRNCWYCNQNHICTAYPIINNCYYRGNPISTIEFKKTGKQIGIKKGKRKFLPVCKNRNKYKYSAL